MNVIDKAEAITDAALRSMKPSEVDEILAELHRSSANLSVELGRLAVSVYRAAGATHTRSKGWSLDWDEALRIAGQKGSPTAGACDRNLAERERVRAAIYRFDGEYVRRGRWERAFLVTGGHVHSSQSCSSCNKGEQPTQFSWLPALSGLSEAEIIEQASDRACTVCYPDAPVARGLTVPKSKLTTEEEREREAARSERERVKAAKAAKAAASAITDIDGRPLREDGGRGSVLKTISSTRTRLKSECWYQYAWEDKDGRHEREIQHLARAIAWREAGLPLHVEPSREQINAVIEPVRVKAVKEVDKARANGR